MTSVGCDKTESSAILSPCFQMKPIPAPGFAGQTTSTYSLYLAPLVFGTNNQFRWIREFQDENEEIPKEGT